MTGTARPQQRLLCPLLLSVHCASTVRLLHTRKTDQPFRMTAGDTTEFMDHAVSAALSLPPNTIPIFAGYAAFASSLALSTLLQLKVLGVSTGSHRPIPSLVGLASVALSSLASHNASIKAHDFLSRQEKSVVMTQSTMTSSDEVSFKQPPRWKSEMLHFGSIQIDKQTLRM